MIVVIEERKGRRKEKKRKEKKRKEKKRKSQKERKRKKSYMKSMLRTREKVYIPPFESQQNRLMW